MSLQKFPLIFHLNKKFAKHSISPVQLLSALLLSILVILSVCLSYLLFIDWFNREFSQATHEIVEQRAAEAAGRIALYFRRTRESGDYSPRFWDQKMARLNT